MTADLYAYDLADIPADAHDRALAILRRRVPVTAPAPYEDDMRGRYLCVHCGRMTPCDHGGADLLPFGCATCWCKAYRHLRAAALLP